MEASGMYSSVWSPCFSRLFPNVRGRLKAGLQACTLTKQKNDIQTRLRELPLDKLGEMLAELGASNENKSSSRYHWTYRRNFLLARKSAEMFGI